MNDQQPKPQQTKSKIKRMVESGKIYITATFNNTLVTITDEKVHLSLSVHAECMDLPEHENLPHMPEQ
jgi:ribosomal protein S11